MDFFEDSRFIPPQDTALICLSGHVLNAHLEELSEPPKFCSICGEATINACPACGARLLGDYPHMRGFMRVAPGFCPKCSGAFPWQKAALERAQRIVQMQMEIHNLDEETSRALERFAQDIAQEKATPEEASTFGYWLRKKAGIESAKAIGGALKDIATGVISEVIVKVMIRGGN